MAEWKLNHHQSWNLCEYKLFIILVAAPKVFKFNIFKLIFQFLGRNNSSKSSLT